MVYKIIDNNWQDFKRVKPKLDMQIKLKKE